MVTLATYLKETIPQFCYPAIKKHKTDCDKTINLAQQNINWATICLSCGIFLSVFIDRVVLPHSLQKIKATKCTIFFKLYRKYSPSIIFKKVKITIRTMFKSTTFKKKPNKFIYVYKKITSSVECG